LHANPFGLYHVPELRLAKGKCPLNDEPTARAAPAGAAVASAIELRNLAVAFTLPSGSSYQAVAATNLNVSAREFVAVVGPTGCGKSTLLNVAAGLLAPSAGEAFIFGAPLLGLNQSAGYLLQQDALMPWKTARDNVAIGLEVGGTPRRQALQAADGWLKNVGLAAFADRYPHQLSGGQKKRVGLAQVLIRDPKILLMDEPFGPLDAQTRQIIGTLLLELWAKDRKAVLFITHDLEEAIALADRVLIMSAGPEAGIIGDYSIDLGRPRDASEIRLLPQFQALHKAIWTQLKDEVMRAYAGGGA
jgi:NitT/TauT family transport system ATP-binding protein